ncbi:MAG: YeeE/YedE thiosulfate transporter family protein [Acidiferrobacterales bacterium]
MDIVTNRIKRLHFVVVLVLAITGSSALIWSQQSAAEIPTQIPWMQAAKEGKADAQYIMGNAYASGMPNLAIKKDPKAAFSWYLKAAKQNHVNAQYEVAAAYIIGDGVKRNLDSARSWLKKAADGGHKDAKEVLAGFPAAKSTIRKTASSAPAKIKRLSKRTVPASAPASPGGYEIAGIRVDPMDMVDAVVNVDLFTGYWPWWLGGIALGFVTVGFWMVIKTTLGVSSSFDRIISWREDKDMAKAAAIMQETPGGVLESAMMAATMEQFGDDIPDDLIVGDAGGVAAASQPMTAPTIRVPWPAHVTFLIATAGGAYLAAFSTGTFELQMDMGDTFSRFFGSGILMWTVLLGGGLMIGFGTRMGGGCTSGHGLSGCSRLQPGSLLGTASFFGTAIAVSMLMELFL